MTIDADVFVTTTVAMCVFFLGYAIVRRSPLLRDYAIPEPYVGGVVFAVVVALVHVIADVTLAFDMARRDTLLVYFFAALGLRSNPRELLANGRPLLVLVTLASVFLILQNLAGIATARLFDFPPQVGIVAGSMALIGRSGTTIAWAPVFYEQYGLPHLSRLGLAVNMAGLIAACCLGGPIARSLIRRHHLKTSGPGRDLEIGFSQDAEPPRFTYHNFLLALLRIHIAIIGGQAIAWSLNAAGVFMPLYITSLIAGIALGNVKPRIAHDLDWPGSDQGLTLISYVCLGLFYTMTFMSVQLWTAGEFFAFLVAVMIVQVLLAVAFIYFAVFRLMGRDYEAAVIAGGFAGIALGSSATTMAVMSAVTKQYGRAHKAFVIVPLTCGVFIDVINSFAITLFASLS